MVLAVIAALLGAGGFAGYKIVKENQYQDSGNEVQKVEYVIDGDTHLNGPRHCLGSTF